MREGDGEQQGRGADMSPVAVKFKAPSPSDTLSRGSAADKQGSRWCLLQIEPLEISVCPAGWGGGQRDGG